MFNGIDRNRGKKKRKFACFCFCQLNIISVHFICLLCSIATGICIEDVVQTLIDLQLAHTRTITIETHYKQ